MTLKEKVLARANGHVENNRRIRESFHKRYNRCFVIVDDGGRIFDYFASKRGAENELERQKRTSYYDDYSQKMVSPGAGRKIICIEEKDLLPLDSKQLWYNTMLNEYQHLGGMAFNFKMFYWIIDKYDLPLELKDMAKKYGTEIQSGRFTANDEYEKNKIILRHIY